MVETSRYSVGRIKYLLHNYAQLREGSQPSRTITQRIRHKLKFGPKPPLSGFAELADLEQAVRLLPGDPLKGLSEKRVVVTYMRLSKMTEVSRETGISLRTCWRYFGQALARLEELM